MSQDTTATAIVMSQDIGRVRNLVEGSGPSTFYGRSTFKMTSVITSRRSPAGRHVWSSALVGDQRFGDAADFDRYLWRLERERAAGVLVTGPMWEQSQQTRSAHENTG